MEADEQRARLLEEAIGRWAPGGPAALACGGRGGQAGPFSCLDGASGGVDAQPSGLERGRGAETLLRHRRAGRCRVGAARPGGWEVLVRGPVLMGGRPGCRKRERAGRRGK